ncbi:MAG: polysaccharide biosynthesis protein [Proteobacteria bacterium]|nr:polysaccharide biosynthesis protein [Pseudomonadota bacterium]
MISSIDNLRGWQKTSLAVLHDFVASAISLLFALSLAFGKFEFLTEEPQYFLGCLALVATCQLVVFYFCGLYRGIWRFSSAPDLIRVVRGASLGVMASYLALFLFTRLEHIPRSSLVIDWLLLVIFLGGGRFSYRLMKVVAFVDDNKSYLNKWVHRVPVAGTIDQIPWVCEKYKVNKIVIAIPNASSETLGRIIARCKGLSVVIKRLPKMSDYLSGKIDPTQLQNVGLEDLIGRKAAVLEVNQISLMLKGSELCAQIAKFKPKKIIAVEISEFNLYQLEQNLLKLLPKAQFEGLIVDIKDKPQMEKVFSHYRPQVAIHAAAYKHVPIMEKNPEQAISNNIHGTRVVAELATKYRLDRFVMVSTDKAVNPTNIMGATKRIAEMICQHYQSQTNVTKFAIVRFGNVIGSSGSVIPLFLKQIKEGGPVTVTHPEVNRFFMSISEAAQLILQASVIGKGGEIFVLDMGSPVKIVDLARQLIILNGLQEGKDIEIVFTGLRPGEKLYEEVLFESEVTLETSHPMIRVAKAREVGEKFNQHLDSVLGKSQSYYPSEIQDRVQTLVPEYQPQLETSSPLSPQPTVH